WKLNRCLVLAVAGVVMCSLLNLPLQAESKGDSRPNEAAVERARNTAKMLDQIYKTTIVLVTDKYVNEEDDFAAGSAAVLLFKQISDGGTHQVRLLDASGEPYDEANVAKDDFEKAGIKALKGGASV